ncbi:MAG: PRC-barrel domain-containing protein [Bradyrhizobiaceae bacterium]|nr:PRC-barrel domain-containing protein [Bradyrhizobiaceae bacterium]
MNLATPTQPEISETHTLIASDRIEGTPVRGIDSRKIGFIKRLMIDKHTGRVRYAVMNCGGFLGIGGEYRAVPWDALQYDPVLSAYRLTLSEDELRAALASDTGEDFDWGERPPKLMVQADLSGRRYWG